MGNFFVREIAEKTELYGFPLTGRKNRQQFLQFLRFVKFSFAPDDFLFKRVLHQRNVVRFYRQFPPVQLLQRKQLIAKGLEEILFYMRSGRQIAPVCPEFYKQMLYGFPGEVFIGSDPVPLVKQHGIIAAVEALKCLLIPTQELFP